MPAGARNGRPRPRRTSVQTAFPKPHESSWGPRLSGACAGNTGGEAQCVLSISQWEARMKVRVYRVAFTVGSLMATAIALGAPRKWG
jgi:hypothetical protein